ncbi:MAG: HAD-IA family hydrolase [Firmicutes bacterium]|nr:HAD-IA family hydrolase [Bacillota bacterium]
MLIFDLDGTLTDSNGIWVDVDKIFLARRGVPYTQEYYEGVAHTILQNCAIFTKEFLNLEESCEEIIAEWMELAQNAYDNVPLKAGVRDYLDRCKAEGHRMVIFTACVPEHCMTAVKHHGLDEYFEDVIFAQKMGMDKKSPEIFRKVAEMLNVSPEECVFYDDSISACRGAKEAGMTVIGVYDDFFEEKRSEMEEVCDRYILGFDELVK